MPISMPMWWRGLILHALVELARKVGVPLPNGGEFT